MGNSNVPNGNVEKDNRKTLYEKLGIRQCNVLSQEEKVKRFCEAMGIEDTCLDIAAVINEKGRINIESGIKYDLLSGEYERFSTYGKDAKGNKDENHFEK